MYVCTKNKPALERFSACFMQCASCCIALTHAASALLQVYACTKNKPTLQILKPLMERSPAPCSMPAFSKLKEAYQQAQAWLARATEPLAGTVTELRVLEALCSDASRIAVVMPGDQPLPSQHHHSIVSLLRSPVVTMFCKLLYYLALQQAHQAADSTLNPNPFIMGCRSALLDSCCCLMLQRRKV